MMWFKLIALLPELIKLLQAMQTAINQAETDRKVKDDIRLVAEAFKTKDSTKLNQIFNGVPK